jgi:signal transduction histidine kinase
MVRAIDSDEQHEVAAARADLTSIRRDTILLGALLALTALGAAAVGLIQLQRANRDLAGEVAARTADLRAIDQSRRLFFAKASHELRTPSPRSAPWPRWRWTAARMPPAPCATSWRRPPS